MSMIALKSLGASGHVGLLSIERPEALNALNTQVLDELNQALDQIPRSAYRVLIVTGSGEKAFVAGADIKELDGLSQDEAKSFSQKGQSVFCKMEELKIPVIAAVNGFALGGGLELAMGCDFIFASENAKFGLPEVTLGIMPGFGGTVRLSRFVGLPRAKEMVYSGQMISAHEAHRIGLVNRLFPSVAELLSETQKLAEIIATRGPLGVAGAKEVTHRSHFLNLDEGLRLEAQAFGNLFQTEDQREGTKAFIEKRKAHFQGR